MDTSLPLSFYKKIDWSLERYISSRKMNLDYVDQLQYRLRVFLVQLGRVKSDIRWKELSEYEKKTHLFRRWQLIFNLIPDLKLKIRRRKQIIRLLDKRIKHLEK